MTIMPGRIDLTGPDTISGAATVVTIDRVIIDATAFIRSTGM